MVEFGFIALLFVLMLFGIVDFGMLLNGWINVSTGSAAGARWAVLGNDVAGIYSKAKASSIVPGLSSSSVKVIVQYTSPTNAYSQTNFCRGYYPTPPQGPYTEQVNGASITCAGEASPSDPPNDTLASVPAAGDSVQVTVIADTFEVITPLVRPFFGCSPSASHCYVPLTSSTTMRYETSQ
jgi:Flp pilus assembly protein TadG